jgi:lipoprotein-releasing system permease protein
MNRWLPFEWIVAVRFLREGRMQTLFIISGIAIGVAVIVFMSALLVGLQANFIRRVLTAQSHIQLLPPREVARALGPPSGARPGTLEDPIVQAPLQRLKSIDQWQAIMAQIRAMPDVVVVSPTAAGSALVVRGDASRAISVTGIFDLGNKGANQRTTYVALHTAQSLLGLAGGVSSIDVTVKDVYAAETIAQRITAATGVEADSWIATNAQFFTAVQAQKTSNTTIRFFVGLSVAFGIASVLVVSVVQKSREIGILRAMGISRGQVLRVFLLQGGVLGLAGSVGGSAMGLAALMLWQRYARNPDGTPFFPLAIEPGLFVATLLLATLTGLAAAFAPALRAARLDPVVAIRG